MKSSVVAGRPRITMINDTRHAVWVAVYKRSPRRANEPPIAWQVVSLPSRGTTAVFTPREYQICARYSFEPENPRQPVYQTNVLQVSNPPAGAGFAIEGVSSPDRRTWGALLARAAEPPERYQIRVVNRFAIGVWSHVRQDGRDLFSPRILPPTAVCTEDLSSPFYVAVLPLPRTAGDLLLDSEVTLTEIAVSAGEGVKIQGGPLKGFKISRISEGGFSDCSEPDALKRAYAPGAPEKKSKKNGEPRAKVKKREGKKTVKKAAKKTAKKRAAGGIAGAPEIG